MIVLNYFHEISTNIDGYHYQVDCLIQVNMNKVVIKIFTARCYAERGYATVCRLSVCQCLSVRDVQVP